ncbi:MAG: hypothetical protein MZW92_31635 [Comamonadaceae bacterium]|nr:hypothetical protein [Comamonadaceae bacterium]
MPWDDVTCPNCRSARLDLQSATVAPPFKPYVNVDSTDALMSPVAHFGGSFGLDQLDGKQLKTAWGRDAQLDQLRLRAEVQFGERMPDAHAALLPVISFSHHPEVQRGVSSRQRSLVDCALAGEPAAAIF